MIPARYGSRRFEGKALADMDGKPMIQRVYESVMEAKGIDWITVVTDDRRIYDTVKSFGGNAMTTRGTHNTGTDRIAEVADTLGLKNDDIVVNVQGDQPCVHPEHIEKAVSLLKEDRLCAMSTLAYEIQNEAEVNDHNSVKVVFDKDFNAIYFSRWPIPYRRNGNGAPYYKHLGVYAYRRWFLKTYTELPEGSLEISESLEQLRVIENGYKIKVALTDIDSPSVDTPSDLQRVNDDIARIGGCAG
jgi:3-deoxy-manno-octulosonate cytidylyltransferase (CMP-KDO synthetase)